MTFVKRSVLFHNATDEEIWDALTTAQAREIVENKDGQLDFKLEQNGRNLSGGQRQRLTIARAVVKKPEFLILDDSASALDFATDAALRRSLHQLSGNVTTFLVSQRAASIRQAFTMTLSAPAIRTAKSISPSSRKNVKNTIHQIQPYPLMLRR